MQLGHVGPAACAHAVRDAIFGSGAVAASPCVRYRKSMLRSRPIVLLTGFGPFPRVPANATSLLVPRLAEAAARAFPGVRIVAEILPTEWIAGPERALALYTAHDPRLAIHFGVSPRATGFAIETRGRNCCAPSPDAAGALPAAACCSPDGPSFLPTGLPATLIVERLRRRGIPAHLSRDAGSYLCNALMYRTLELARRNGSPACTGFVHLPETLVDPRRPAREPLASSPLRWSDVIEGGLEIIAASLGRHRAPAHGLGRMPALNPFPSAAADA